MNIKEFATTANAIEYNDATEKLTYVSDLLGCSVDHPAVEALEQRLELILSMNKSYTAEVASDLYRAGDTEDGTPFIAEVYYVTIENSEGRQFQHDAFFPGVAVCFYTDEDGHNSSYFDDCREEAQAKAERLASRVNQALQSGKGIDLAHWREIDPVYGSDEYIAQGTEAKRAFEERCAG